MAEMTDGMRSLVEDIMAGCEDRKRTIKELKADAVAVRREAQRVLVTAKMSRKEMAAQQRVELEHGRKELSHKVKGIREDFRAREKAVREDLAEARRVWGNMKDALRSKSR